MGICSMFGPTPVALVPQATGRFELALSLISVVMLLSSVLPMLLRQPKESAIETAAPASDASQRRRIA